MTTVDAVNKFYGGKIEQNSQNNTQGEGQTRDFCLTFAWLIRSPTNVDTSMERDTDALFLRASALLKGKTDAGGSSGTVTVYDWRRLGMVTTKQTVNTTSIALRD